jgi:hypothetical protein
LSWGISIFKPFLIYQGVITMKQIFKSKPGRVASMFKTTALAALLASTLMAAGAEAAVLITDVHRGLRVKVGNLQADLEFSGALSGAFDKTVTSQQLFDDDASVGFFTATATQSSTVDAQVFAGTGSAAFAAPRLGTTEALSAYFILFTLTETYVFGGFANLIVEQDPTGLTEPLARSKASLEKVLVDGSKQDIFNSFVDDTSSVLFTLLPGVYELGITTNARGSPITGNIPHSAQGSFDFRFTLTEVADVPPNNVPEPGSLALMGAGVLAAAASRRKRPLQLTHA